MSKYTSDDNRSMQLNDNNERYYSSRGDSDYEDDYEDVSKTREAQYDCGYCAHCQSNDGLCLYPEDKNGKTLQLYSTHKTYQEEATSPPEALYERLLFLWDSCNKKADNGAAYIEYKDEYNEYRRGRRELYKLDKCYGDNFLDRIEDAHGLEARVVCKV